MWVLCLNWNRSGAAARSRCPRCWSWNPETSRTEPPQPEPTPAGRGGRHQLKPIPKVKTTTTTWQEANYLNGARTHIKLRTEGEGGESSLQLLIGCRKAASYSRAKIRCRKTKQKQTKTTSKQNKQTNKTIRFISERMVNDREVRGVRLLLVDPPESAPANIQQQQEQQHYYYYYYYDY